MQNAILFMLCRSVKRGTLSVLAFYILNLKAGVMHWTTPSIALIEVMVLDIHVIFSTAAAGFVELQTLFVHV